jgi:hypothetical protein
MSDSPTRPQRPPLVSPGQIDCHIADMTATISAEMTLAAAQSALAAHNQWIAIDGPSDFPIRRLVEQNSSGPLRLGFGAWRDQLLGCQFLARGGSFITAGGRTMKNVAGYDLVKLMVGQHGLLGSLVTITTRTYRRPSAALLVEFDPSDTFLGTIITTPLRPRYAMLNRDKLYCGWLDDERAITFYETHAAQFSPRRLTRCSIEQDIALRAKLWHVEGHYFRASIPPTRILEFAERDSNPSWVADAAFGIVIGPYAESAAPRIENAAENCGGSVTFYPANQSPRWNATAVEQSILNSLKNAFAPAGC